MQGIYDSRCVALPLTLLLSVAIGMTVGCGGSAKTDSLRARETSRLKGLLTLYLQAAVNLGHNPVSEEEFKQEIAKSKIQLDVFGVESSEEFFISERDGQPFVIFYGPNPKGVTQGVVAYEQTGVDGIRRVGFKIGQIEDADAARFAELVPSPPTAPAK